MERKIGTFVPQISERERNDANSDVTGSKTIFNEKSFRSGELVDQKTRQEKQLSVLNQSKKGKREINHTVNNRICSREKMEAESLDRFPTRDDRKASSSIKNYKAPQAKPDTDKLTMIDVCTVNHNKVANANQIPVPQDYKASQYSLKIKEGTHNGWTEGHNVNVDIGSLNEKALLYMDIGSNWEFKAVLSFLEPLKENLAYGNDYKIVKTRGKTGGRDVDRESMFIKFKTVKAAMLGAFMIGDIAGDGCFLKVWAQTPFFASQFITETGVHNDITIYWVEANRWSRVLQNKINTFLKCGEAYSKGFMRDEMARARFNTAVWSENNGWIRTEPKFPLLPNHFANVLDSRLKENNDMLPEGIQLDRLRDMLKNGGYVFTNR